MNTRQSSLRPVLLVAAATFIYMMNGGIRANFGIMLSAIAKNAALSYASVSFVLAVGQLCFGITQPVFGVLANRKGSRFSLLTGTLLTVLSTALLPLCTSQWSLLLMLGILLPGGLGAISYGILIGTITPGIPQRRRALANGVVNSSNGLGNTILTPILSTAIAAGGLARGTGVLTVLTALMLPVILWLCRGEGPAEAPVKSSETLSAGELVRMGAASRDYCFIVIGFFTCGFHMAIISNHLATQICSYGYSYAQSSYAFSLYGIATIAGALGSGSICNRLRQKNLLGALYGARAVITVVFFLLPKTMVVICLYIMLLGATGASTISPVSGICQRLFGVRGMTIFFSFAFFVHQIGGFLSAWLGGICYEQFGSYTLVWTVDICLCALAALVSFLIRVKDE